MVFYSNLFINSLRQKWYLAKNIKTGEWDSVVVASFYLRVGQRWTWKRIWITLIIIAQPSLFTSVVLMVLVFCHMVWCLTWGWNNHYTPCHELNNANYDLLHPEDSSYAKSASMECNHSLHHYGAPHHVKNILIITTLTTYSYLESHSIIDGNGYVLLFSVFFKM